jgi:hypothetical protein
MIAEQLVERTRDLILKQIKDNIASALTVIRSDRADSKVTTEPPRQYLIYSPAFTYQCPAVFTIVDSADFRDEQDGQNYLSASVKIFVSVVVEDKDQVSLTIKTERYQAALFRLLHRVHLLSTSGDLKLYSRVVRAEFSPLFTKDGELTKAMNVFRKEVALQLDVRHFENPS